MKWTCPKCPELNHGTRHESVNRHIRRKHEAIGEPINLNTGLTRSQAGLKSYGQGLSGFPHGPPFYPSIDNSKSGKFDLYDYTEKFLLQPLRQQVELSNLLSQRRTIGLCGSRQNSGQTISSDFIDLGMPKPIGDLFGIKIFVCEICLALN
jgi:hypothetical protein